MRSRNSTCGVRARTGVRRRRRRRSSARSGIHRLLERGPNGFNELETAVDGVSSKVLSNSLDDLAEHQLVNRETISEKPVRVQYSLTPHGRSLEPVIYAMRDWGLEHLTEPDDADDSA